MEVIRPKLSNGNHRENRLDFSNIKARAPFPCANFPATFRSRTTKHEPPMDPTIAALAKAAGLHKALAEFPDDIEAAAAQALGHAEAVKYPTDPTAEPWPPMQAEPTL